MRMTKINEEAKTRHREKQRVPGGRSEKVILPYPFSMALRDWVSEEDSKGQGTKK